MKTDAEAANYPVPGVTWQFEDKEPTEDDLEVEDDRETVPESGSPSLLSVSLTVLSLFSLGSPKLESLLAKSSPENVTVL